MITAENIYEQLQAMPPHLQGEVLDFIAFIQHKNGITAGRANRTTTANHAAVITNQRLCGH